jgi:hypothetical protein
LFILSPFILLGPLVTLAWHILSLQMKKIASGYGG